LSEKYCILIVSSRVMPLVFRPRPVARSVNLGIFYRCWLSYTGSWSDSDIQHSLSSFVCTSRAPNMLVTLCLCFVPNTVLAVRLFYSPNNFFTRFITLSLSGSYGWSFDGISKSAGNASLYESTFDLIFSAICKPCQTLI